MFDKIYEDENISDIRSSNDAHSETYFCVSRKAKDLARYSVKVR